MYRTQKFVRRFNMNEDSDVAEYEAILNNPNALILDRMKEKITAREMDPDSGRVISMNDHVELLVTWQERTLL